MIGIEKPNIEVFNQEENSTYGKFTLEPLERGFGTTLGNSMRRVLLSSLPGYAITSVKIDGKVHEFDTIPGVKEDITEIVLNLKSVIIKINARYSRNKPINFSSTCDLLKLSAKDDELSFFRIFPRIPHNGWNGLADNECECLS